MENSRCWWIKALILAARPELESQPPNTFQDYDLKPVTQTSLSLSFLIYENRDNSAPKNRGLWGSKTIYLKLSHTTLQSMLNPLCPLIVLTHRRKQRSQHSYSAVKHNVSRSSLSKSQRLDASGKAKRPCGEEKALNSSKKEAELWYQHFCVDAKVISQWGSPGMTIGEES